MKFKEIRTGGTLESRARHNHRSIDGEWIFENESKEFDLNKYPKYDDDPITALDDSLAADLNALLNEVDLYHEDNETKEVDLNTLLNESNNTDEQSYDESDVEKQIEYMKNNLDKYFR